MPGDETERLLIHFGELLATDTQYPIDGTLLYARLHTQFCAPSIFKDRGNFILYRQDPDLDVICPPLYALWGEMDPGKRWTAMEYVVRDGRFTVTYNFDEIDEEQDMLQHRDRVVARNFGTKPIVYPDLPADMQPGYVPPGYRAYGDDDGIYYR